MGSHSVFVDRIYISSISISFSEITCLFIFLRCRELLINLCIGPLVSMLDGSVAACETATSRLHVESECGSKSGADVQRVDAISSIFEVLLVLMFVHVREGCACIHFRP